MFTMPKQASTTKKEAGGSCYSTPEGSFRLLDSKNLNSGRGRIPPIFHQPGVSIDDRFPRPVNNPFILWHGKANLTGLKSLIRLHHENHISQGFETGNELHAKPLEQQTRSPALRLSFRQPLQPRRASTPSRSGYLSLRCSTALGNYG